MIMEKRFLKITEIDWDTDGDNELFDTLPKKIELELDENDVNVTDIYELEDYVSDYITNEFGYCHFGFNMCIYFDTRYGLIHPAGRFNENETFYDLYDIDNEYLGELYVDDLNGVTSEDIVKAVNEYL